MSRTTACQSAKRIGHFYERSQAVQVAVRRSLLFMPQDMLDGEQALALLGKNGSRKMTDGVKAKAFTPALSQSLSMT